MDSQEELSSLSSSSKVSSSKHHLQQHQQHHHLSGGGGGGVTSNKKGGDRKSARARTVLSEKQLNILKTCYSANPRPDALMKEQLVEMTGLSPRVIRVWFQNKRCKDKKKLAMKHGKVSLLITSPIVLYCTHTIVHLGKCCLRVPCQNVLTPF